jgi:hypothetical protein
MGRQMVAGGTKKALWGRGLAAVALMVLLVEIFTLARPLWGLAKQLHQGLLGVIPAVGMCLLNATNALAFHRVDNFWLAAHLLVLSCAMTGLIAGIGLLRPKAKRTLLFELALAPEFHDRETINNGSR